MYSFNEFKLVYSITTKCRGEGHGKILKMCKVVAQFNAVDVIHNIKQSDSGTCVASSL
jgi:hypothetical protein